MKKVFFSLLVALSSCSGFDGKIETRQDGRVYLVNESKSKGYSFTVKKTTVINDSGYKYETKQIDLSAGDEVFLGAESGTTETRYPEVDSLFFTLYKVVPKKEKDNEIKKALDRVWGISETKKNGGEPSKTHIRLVSKGDVFRVENVGDTVINGEKVRYGYVRQPVVDSLHPFPVKSYKQRYEVTGQVETKRAN